MSEIKDGGPAFPGKASINRSSGELEPHQFGNDDFETLGMTLRDYFAAKAMQAVVMKQNELHDIQAMYDRLAMHAYKVADAMLCARGAA